MADTASSGSVPAELPRPSRPRRPNYNQLHAKPFPLQIFPLPILIPHNPLSILHIAVAYAKQVLFPPSSHPTTPVYGYFLAETHSVHVTDELSIHKLWESGFFGKGSLSRSEPSWLVREKGKRGLSVGITSEEVTKRRREERKAFKHERARKEREEIEAKLRNERILGDQKDEGLPAPQVLEKALEGYPLISGNKPNRGATTQHPVASLTPRDLSIQEPTTAGKPAIFGPAIPNAADEVGISNEEHLQLDLSEAFFLAYAMGVLVILSPESGDLIPIYELLPLFMAASSSQITSQSLFTPQLEPDNMFLLSYVSYHHFRSLGWVVRSGIKFGVDWMLYNRGPVFSHAEFAVTIIPAYSHGYWKDQETRKRSNARGQKEWHWLHMVNRVQSQVRKTLVLCYVEVPPPFGDELVRGVDIAKILANYKVREIIIRRWVPNRSRD